MPLPLIPLVAGGLVASALGYGAKKGYDAYKDSNEASEKRDEGEQIYSDAVDAFKPIQDKTDKAFEQLGKEKQRVLNGSLERFAKLIARLEVANDDYTLEINGKDIELAKIGDSVFELTSMLGGAIAAGGAGALAGLGAFGSVGLLGAASTGTAISSLTGVAATNATLAWFGGGALSAGGLGMAGGTLVISGIVAAPVIAVAAAIFAYKAETAKENARAFKMYCKQAAEALNAQQPLLKKLCYKGEEKRRSLIKMDLEFSELLDQVEKIADNKGNNLANWSSDEQDKLHVMVNTAESVIAIINEPILNDNDELTKNLIALQEKHAEILRKIEAKYEK
ncbi:MULTISPECIES: hypothetical protein [Campylobacter]|uniref:hypothetical protein n=1 Tax=Campylobacter TaxID=194 RepID=UPI000A33E128|nr:MULTISPECIES: hypothetical protein [unclassified Campylobacter]